MGKGSFGTVYTMHDYYFSKFDEFGSNIAAKIQKIDNRGNTKNGAKYQEMAVNEIQFNRALNIEDPMNIYFPLIHECVNVTSQFDSILNN